MESILITGASGFIGSFIVEEALKRKFGVWAGIRPTSSKKYLKNRKIHFLELDFAHPNELRAQLSGHKGTYNKFDYIIHCAGVTKCPDKNTFDYVNYLQTKYFIDTLKALNMVPKQFIYISTLSVFGPVREKDYSPIEAGDVPMPNTAYGLSKLKAELYIQSIPGFPYVIYRPTGVYGPRELDYFLIDLPPGTSDIHLTVVQTLAMTGAIVVSTPQAVALADARKGINMFTNDKVNVPILGLVENMAWFTPAELPENKYYIFGKEGAKKLAEEMNVPLLGQIPIVQSICEGGDNGTPVALDEDSVTGRAFLSLAASVVRQVDRRNVEMAPTQIVEMHK